MHFEKYKKNQIMKMLEHYNREHITKNVDISRTELNYYAYNDKIELSENGERKNNISYQIKKYIDDQIRTRSKRKLKDDSVLMVDLIIDQPNYLGKEYDKNFFDTMIDKIQNYIPYENIIQVAIHCDETTPHMHLSFMPLIADKKKGGEKLCAKEFLTRDFLKSFHKQMEKDTGYKLTVDDDRVKNLSMEQYQKMKDKEKELSQDLDIVKNNIKEIENKKIDLLNEISEQNKHIEKYSAIKELNNTKIKNYDKEISEQEKEIKELKKNIKDNSDTIKELSDETKKEIEKAAAYNYKNNIRNYEDMQIYDIEKIEPITIPTKKDIMGKTIFDNIKLEQFKNTLEKYNKTITENNNKMYVNLNNIKSKREYVDGQFNIANLLKEQAIKDNSDIPILKKENVNLKEQIEILKSENKEIPKLKAQIKGIQLLYNIIDNLKNYMLKNTNLSEKQIDNIAEPKNENEYTR